jgi:hypothetical protein
MGFGLRNRQTPTGTTSAANAIAISAMVIFVDPLFVAQNSERLIAHRLSAHSEKHNGCQTGVANGTFLLTLDPLEAILWGAAFVLELGSRIIQIGAEEGPKGVKQMAATVQ